MDPESFAKGGQTLMVFWGGFYCEWREDPNSTKIGPLSARQRNAI